MNIAILTMFNGLAESYSPVSVTAAHIALLLKHGFNVSLLVSEDCPDAERSGIFADERLEWVKVTNRLKGKRIHWRDYAEATGTVHDSFYAETDAIADDLVKKLQGVDICMLHDILYQGWHLVHNIALRKAQRALPNLRFISFTHSVPQPRPQTIRYPFSARFSPMPNTLYVYPTQSGLDALAKQYNVPKVLCRAVNHPFAYVNNLSDAAQMVCNAIDLFTPEIVAIYPARLTCAKKLEKVAAFIGAMKTQCKSATVVFCDFPATDTNASAYKAIIRHNGVRFGLDSQDMLFTSDIGFANGFPHSAVTELFSLANLFVCPSFSESFGLTVLEAAAAKNTLVLNGAVPALNELGTRLHAHLLRWDALGFGVQTTEEYHPSEEAYYAEHCAKILSEMRENPAIYAHTTLRHTLNPEYVFEKQIMPLLYADITQ